MSDWLARLALLARRRYRSIFAIFAGVLLLAGVAISRLTFDTDVLNLLPRHDPAVESYVEMLRDFGSNTFLMVLIRLPEGAVPEPYEGLADDLAARLAKLPEIKRVQHKLGSAEDLLTTFFPKALFFLDDGALRQLAERLSSAGIRRRTDELRLALRTPQGLAVKELAEIDPLGLSDLVLGRMDSSRSSLKVDWGSGYYLSRDHRVLLLLAEPRKSPQDIPFDERLSRDVEREAAAALARWPALAGADGPPRPVVDIGGPYVTALTDASLIRQDMFVNMATSALAVLLLFLIAFRRFGALAYAFVPLLSGLTLTFGFAAVVFGALSSATSVCAALLIGLGIDFVIVSYGRYVEERRQGRGVDEALATMARETGVAVVASATTTAGTFYAFTFTRFTGLRQMGILTGTGILFCMAAVLLLLPAMLAWSADRDARRQDRPPRLHLFSFGSYRLTAWSLRRPGAALACGGVLTLVALGLSRGLAFDDSMTSMRPTVNRGSSVSTEVARRFGSGFDSMILALQAPTLEGCLALSQRAVEKAAPLVASGELLAVNAPSSLIPPLERQRQVIAWLAAQRTGALDMRRIRGETAADLRQAGLRPDFFAPGLDLLERALTVQQPIGVADFLRTPQTALLLERLLKQRPDGTWRAAVYLSPPPDNRWRREVPPGVARLTAELGGAARLAGINVVNQRIREVVLRDAWIAGLLGLGLVAVILWIDFRELRSVLLALTPLLVGITWMVGSMVAFGIKMNFINIFVTTMIVGIGTDYGIYVLHRYGEVRNAAGEAFVHGLRETGRAVAVAAICTIVGFGSITFSHYPGLRSTGEVAVLGALCTSLVAITLVPAYLAWSEARRRAASAAAEVEDGVARRAEEA